MARPEKYALVLGLTLIVTGCAREEGFVFKSPATRKADKAHDKALASSHPESTDTNDALTETQTAGIDPETFKDAVKELKDLSRTDPELYQEFVTQLENTDPALVGRLVQTWKAVLAYKKRQQADEAQLASTKDEHSSPAGETEIEDPFAAPLTELTPGVRDDTRQAKALPDDGLSTDHKPSTQGNLDFSSAPVTDLRPFDRVAARPEQPVDYETPSGFEESNGANQPLGLAASKKEPAPEQPAGFETTAQNISTFQEPPQPKSGGSWKGELEDLIAEVQQQSGGGSELSDEVQREVYLRFLYLMAGNRDQALAPIAGLNAEEQEFWTNLLYAMSNQLDREEIPSDADRAAQTIDQLANAAARLRAKANLEVRNLAFCQRIQSFGSYDRFPRYEFKASQPVLLYAEVENFRSESTADGYRTLLRSTIELLDAQGHQVWKQQFAPTEDLCEHYRRDYFHSYNFSMPERIYAGYYVLKLTIEDQLANKVAEGSVEFQIVDK